MGKGARNRARSTRRYHKRAMRSEPVQPAPGPVRVLTWHYHEELGAWTLEDGRSTACARCRVALTEGGWKVTVECLDPHESAPVVVIVCAACGGGADGYSVGEEFERCLPNEIAAVVARGLAG